MDDQKIENLLNVSLSVTDFERQQSRELSTGYNDENNTWEIIVKYAGTEEDFVAVLGKYNGIRYDLLLAGYAIIVAPARLIFTISKEPSVIYVEKPKLMTYEIRQGKSVSCIDRVSLLGLENRRLTGRGIIVAVIDSGIDVSNPEFIDENGNTRIMEIFDQSRNQLVTRNEINDYLNSDKAVNIIGRDFSGHGTNVAIIACGNSGVAFKSDILCVKLGPDIPGSFPKTTQLMRGIDYCVRKSLQLNTPVAINISIGNNYGDHQGNSLLEQYINTVSDIGRNIICIGSGNEGNSATHTGGVLAREPVEIKLSVSEYETSIDLQIWKNYVDEFDVYIIAPDGANLGRIEKNNSLNRKIVANTLVLTFYGEPAPYSTRQEIYISFIPQNSYIFAGIWTIRLVPVNIVSGRYDMWLPSERLINPLTGFSVPRENLTITVPSTSGKAISVGSYNPYTDSISPFSGRGYVADVGAGQLVKPDLAAPGENIRVGNSTVSGTSFATPFVTGSAALLMEWGIVMGNDRFLYGQKVKAYMQKGARPLIGLKDRPNDISGYGALCLADSIPDLF